LRRRKKELIASRDKQRAKNSLNKQEIKNLQRKIERRDKSKRHHYDNFIVFLCVILRVFCRCSYHSVSKIIRMLSFCGVLKISRIPSPVSVQNWVAKVGLYQRQCFDNELIGKDRVLIIDESIRIGKEKQLLILSTAYEKTEEQSLVFSDVAVHYFGGSLSWDGAHISELINDIRERTGMNCRAILSDEDSKLKCAARLEELPHLPDICHATGTCLKKVFNKDLDYQSFIKSLSNYRSRGVNQDF